MLLKSKLKYFIVLSLTAFLGLIYFPYRHVNHVKQERLEDAKQDETENGTITVSKLTTVGTSSVKTTRKPRPNPSENKPPIKILIWGKAVMPQSIPNHALCGGVHPSGSPCTVTSDRSLFNQSEAIVFMMKAAKADDLPDPKWRKTNQAFVWWTRESAWTSKYFYGKQLNDFDNFYNWTMTPRRDSDVNAMLIPFTSRKYVDKILKKQDKMNDDLKRDQKILKFTKNVDYNETKSRDVIKDHVTKMIAAKTDHVAWAASNCDLTKGGNQRLKIVQSMQSKGLKVDIYGKCGTKKLNYNKNQVYKTYQAYKFYFVFENSANCRGYITEKLWFNAFYTGTVPVIWGTRRDDVREVAPPNSFIHYDDFKDEEELIKYLDYLATNVTAYTEYFQWRWEAEEHYPLFGFNDADEYQNLFFGTFANAFCHLCKLLKDEVHLNYHKTIPSLFDHWYGKEHKQCLIR